MLALEFCRSSTLLNKPYDAFADEGADEDQQKTEVTKKAPSQGECASVLLYYILSVDKLLGPESSG